VLKSEKQMPTPCGLDCDPCSIRKVPIDSEAAKEAIDWYKEMGWLKKEEGIKEAIKRKMYCKGCRSDRKDVHWSPDCSILQCCVYEKNFEFCYECDDFPCNRLEEWAKESGFHQKALEKLKHLKEK